MGGQPLSETNANAFDKNKEPDLDLRQMERNWGSCNQVRCVVRRDAHDAMRLVSVVGIRVTVGYGSGRNRQEDKNRHESESSGGFEDCPSQVTELL